MTTPKVIFVAFAIEDERQRDSGQKWEIQCAEEEHKPVLGIWASQNDRTVISGVATSTWSDANISELIDSL